MCDLALLFGGEQARRTATLLSDPSGTCDRYKAKAIGAGSEEAQINLSESYNDNLSMEEAEELAFEYFEAGHEEKEQTENFELARVVQDKGFHIATAEEVGIVLIDCTTRVRVETIRVRVTIISPWGFVESRGGFDKCN